jgi:hypothetical protein
MCIRREDDLWNNKRCIDYSERERERERERKREKERAQFNETSVSARRTPPKQQ